MRRFVVHREECWGGTYVWTIRDYQPERRTHHKMPRPFPTERAARRRCERMNEDWLHFLYGRRKAG